VYIGGFPGSKKRENGVRTYTFVDKEKTLAGEYFQQKKMQQGV
jgi:hypothetical protein